MNDEIKEILKKIKSVSNFDDYVDFVGTEFKPLLDYITNLQQAIKDTKDTADDMLFELKQENSKLEIALQNIQEDYDRRAKENERLKQEQEYNNYCDEQLRKKISNLEYKITTLEDYKSRCEKAVDKLTIKQARFINEKDYVLDDNDLDEIMYILQNGSEKNEC